MWPAARFNKSLNVFLILIIFSIIFIFKVQPSLTTINRYITVTIGSNVSLECPSTTVNVQCQWLRRAHLVRILERYVHLTTDKCNISIAQIRPADGDRWTCEQIKPEKKTNEVAVEYNITYLPALETTLSFTSTSITSTDTTTITTTITTTTTATINVTQDAEPLQINANTSILTVVIATPIGIAVILICCSFACYFIKRKKSKNGNKTVANARDDTFVSSDSDGYSYPTLGDIKKPKKKSNSSILCCVKVVVNDRDNFTEILPQLENTRVSTIMRNVVPEVDGYLEPIRLKNKPLPRPPISSISNSHTYEDIN
ncbi:hypothetical protein CHUAL_003630 [Chamberlinius hualienensis]